LLDELHQPALERPDVVVIFTGTRGRAGVKGIHHLAVNVELKRFERGVAYPRWCRACRVRLGVELPLGSLALAADGVHHLEPSGESAIVPTSQRRHAFISSKKT
jgi:hypothetical protein